MTSQTKATLKGYFNTGDQPSEANFSDLIDSYGRFTTMMIAANNAPAAIKAQADYVCDGAEDEVQIQVAHNALPATGGRIWLSGGTFNIDTTTVSITKPGVTIHGESKNATKVFVNNAIDGFTINSGTAGLAIYFKYCDIWTVLNGTGHGLVLAHDKSNYGEYSSLRFTGGNAAAWAINSQGSCVLHLRDIYAAVSSNGIIFQSVTGGGSDYNWGDSEVEHVEIILAADSLTGIKIVGPDSSIRMINNIHVNQCEVVGHGNTDSGVGFHLRNCSRITLNHIDIENIATGILHEAGQGGGVTNDANAFCHVHSLNNGDSYSVVGSPTHMTVVGGTGDLQSMQMLAGTPFP